MILKTRIAVQTLAKYSLNLNLASAKDRRTMSQSASVRLALATLAAANAVRVAKTGAVVAADAEILKQNAKAIDDLYKALEPQF
jgi:hypothetical protein